MSTMVLPNRLELSASSSKALKTAANFWFLAAVIGQWIFLYYIVAFYGPSTLQGDFQAWSRNPHLPKGYVPGDTMGNLTFAAHVLLAGVTSFGGALQLIPRIRERVMAVHKWNGRVFFVTALVVSVTGLYMVWIRGTRLSLISAIAVSLNAVLIIAFAIPAWRTAMRGEVASHRRWALRSYLVANGQWFMRVGMFSWIIVNRGPVGIKGMGGPFFLIWSFGCYLLPLAVLELYLRASHAGPSARYAMAGGLIVLTILMSLGIFGVSTFVLLPMLGRL